MTHQPPLRGLEDVFRPDLPVHNTELMHFPNVGSDTLKHHGKQIGRAGELLVESILLRMGLPSVSPAEFMPVDFFVFHEIGILRVQVKTAARAKNGCYQFNISHGYHRSPRGVRRYAETDFDLLALVGLQDNVVKFSSDRRRSQSIGVDEVDRLRRRPGESFEQALDALGVVQTRDPAVAPMQFCY
jgi:hypothetical protein